MRIAYLSADPGIPVFGNKGASNHVREFAGALASLGHDVRLFAGRLGGPGGPLPCRLVPVEPVAASEGMPPALHTEAESLARNTPFREALERAHQQEPFDFVYERYSLWSYAGLEFAATHGLPLALEVNSPLRLEQKRYRELHLEGAARAIELLLFRDSTLVIGVSRQVIEYVITQSGRWLPALALPNGVDLGLFSLDRGRRAGEPFTIGFAGSLKPWHGLEILMEAFRKLAPEPGYELLLVGEGPMREWVSQYADRHGFAGRLRLTGGVEKSRVPELLAGMDAAVAPYPVLDQFYFSPLKLFEYMAAGCAIVASRIGQITDILRDGQTALLVPPGDADALAAAVRRLRGDGTLRERLGRAARAEAFQNHGWEARVRTILEALMGGDAARREVACHAG